MFKSIFLASSLKSDNPLNKVNVSPYLLYVPKKSKQSTNIFFLICYENENVFKPIFLASSLKSDNPLNTVNVSPYPLPTLQKWIKSENIFFCFCHENRKTSKIAQNLTPFWPLYIFTFPQWKGQFWKKSFFGELEDLKIFRSEKANPFFLSHNQGHKDKLKVKYI